MRHSEVTNERHFGAARLIFRQMMESLRVVKAADADRVSKLVREGLYPC